MNSSTRIMDKPIRTAPVYCALALLLRLPWVADFEQAPGAYPENHPKTNY